MIEERKETCVLVTIDKYLVYALFGVRCVQEMSVKAALKHLHIIPS